MRFDQFLFRHAVYMPAVWLRGEPLSRCLAELNATQWMPYERLVQLQEEKLTSLVDFAAAHVPYYQSRIDRSRHPKRLTVSDIRNLPTLSKEDLRDRPLELRAVNVGRTTTKTTGGSTGQAVTVSKSRLSTAYELAAMWRGWGWAGIAIGDRQARFWGVPLSSTARGRARLIDFVSHRKRFTAFGMTPGEMANITRTLNRFRPDYAYGYVSILHHYANFLEQSGARQFRPKAVVATSEVLTSTHRAAIQRGFGARVFEEYGCGELGNIAHECEHGSLHLSAENLIVEILQTDTQATNEAGEVVVTELNNHAMPLIRYRLKDYGLLADGRCACGRTLPRLAAVAGRAYDLIYNREGRLFHGEFFMYIFEEARQQGLGFDAFQVVQLDSEHFLVRVRPGTGYGPDSEDFVGGRIRRDYGSYARVAFERVDEIHREPSGKLRLIIGARENNLSA